MGPDSQSKDPRPVGVLDRGTLVVIMRILSLVKEESGLAKIRYGSTFVDYKMFRFVWSSREYQEFVSEQHGRVEGNAMFRKF